MTIFFKSNKISIFVKSVFINFMKRSHSFSTSDLKELEKYFSPYYSLHLGSIKLASGKKNSNVDNIH